MPKVYQRKRQFPKKENDFLSQFMKPFVNDPLCWFFKTHGEPMQTRGIPDVLMCYNGLFVCFEFKIMRNSKLNVTPFQDYTMQKIRGCNGICFVIWYDDSNGETGVGTIRYKEMEDAITWIKNSLLAISQIPCSEFKKLNEAKVQ
jgi:penicillin-binding protein-related factor A (putative recombinase)